MVSDVNVENWVGWAGWDANVNVLLETMLTRHHASMFLRRDGVWKGYVLRRAWLHWKVYGEKCANHVGRPPDQMFVLEKDN